MEQINKYNTAFIEIFGLSENLLPNLVYQSTPAWDSVGHMQLITQLEDVFGITLEMEDILDFSSYEKGIEILRKYGIQF